MHLYHLPSIRERHHGAKQASYRCRPNAGRRGHPPNQFRILVISRFDTAGFGDPRALRHQAAEPCGEIVEI